MFVHINVLQSSPFDCTMFEVGENACENVCDTDVCGGYYKLIICYKGKQVET